MNSRKRGIVAKWFDEKGYGFIDPVGGGPQLFFHINSVSNSLRRDLLGQRVTFTECIGKDGRSAADNVCLVAEGQTPVQRRGRRSGRQGFRGGSLVAWALCLGFLAGIAVASYAGYLPIYVGLVYAGMSIVTFAAYASDKAKANAGLWRTPEATLHWLEMLGGWPGALAAQWHIGHKNRKASYQGVFWLIVILHVAVLGKVLVDAVKVGGEADGPSAVYVEFLDGHSGK